MPTVIYSINHARSKHNKRLMIPGLEQVISSASAEVQLATDALFRHSHPFSPPFQKPSSSQPTPSASITSPIIVTPTSTPFSSNTVTSSSQSSTQFSDVPNTGSDTPSSKVVVPTQSSEPLSLSPSLSPTRYGGDTSAVAAIPTSTLASSAHAVFATTSQVTFSPTTLITTIVEAHASTTQTTVLTSIELSAPTQSALSAFSAKPIAPSDVPQDIGPQPTVASSTTSAASASTSVTSRHPPLSIILGSSIGGGVLLTVVIAAYIVCLVKRRNARGGRHRTRAASRNESFFAAERPLVSPFPTLSRPQSHATTTSLANTLNDEERWAEYRNAYQSPPLLPGAGLVSRDTLLVDHHVEALSPPAQMQDMGYAVLSRSSPLSAAFPREEHIVSPTPSHTPLLPKDASSIRAHAYTSFTAPDSTSSPTSASFPQYIVYDGLDVGSVTDTVATPSGQRIPIAATSSHDSSLQSSDMFAARGSFTSLQSDGSAGSIPPDETSMGMAI